MQKDVFGAKGDFTTSPEISQIFGEARSDNTTPTCASSQALPSLSSPLQLLAVWVLADWMVAGEPRECQLIELGPGRGTLLKDMMRVRAIVYEVSSLLSISLSLASGFCVMLNVAEEHKKIKNDELPWMGFKPAHSRVLLWHCTCTCIYIYIYIYINYNTLTLCRCLASSAAFWGLSLCIWWRPALP